MLVVRAHNEGSTMAEHPNAELLRRGYEAFANGDLDTLREQFSPDIVWHSGGHNALTGDYKGIDEVFGLFGKLFEVTGGDMSQELHDALANDQHAVALSRLRAARPDGRKLDMNQVGVFHVTNGKVTEAWTYPEDQQAADEFFA